MPQRFDHWLYLFATLFGQIHVMGDLMYRVLVSSYGNEWSTIKLKSMCIYIYMYISHYHPAFTGSAAVIVG